MARSNTFKITWIFEDGIVTLQAALDISLHNIEEITDRLRNDVGLIN